MDWAEIPIVDISKAGTPDGRAELVTAVCNAMHTIGMFYAVNHGLLMEEVSPSFIAYLLSLISPWTW